MNTTPHAPRALLGALLVSAIVLSASAARADDTPRIFPLLPAAPLSPELAGAPSALTDALVELLGGVTTDRSLEDFGKKLRCDVEVSSCLDAVARSLVTGRLVYGTIAQAPAGKLKVKLVRFDSAKAGSELYQRTFTLTARTPRRLGKQLARSAAQMFDREPPPETGARPAPGNKPGDKSADKPGDKPADRRAPESGETIVVDDAETDAESEAETERAAAPRPAASSGEPARGRITGSTWGLVGGGALGVAVGAGLLISARGLAADVAAAPHETSTDFRRLTALERAGRIRTQVGGTLLVAGGAALAVGVVRAYLQRGGGKPRSESMERSLALVPVEGGAAIVLAGGLR